LNEEMAMKAQRTEQQDDLKTSPPEWMEAVRRQVGSLRYGVVQVVVHDSRVVQIEKTERTRIDLPPEGR
jgi:hypothetical protein